LPQKGLDETEVQISVDASDLTENKDFTVDRTNGTINFAAGTASHGAPSVGTNNVWITAFKTIDGNKNKITNCTIGIPFGGEKSLMGGTRFFVMGNPSYPYTYWYSDLVTGHGMAYFPDTNFEHIAQNNEPITAAAKMGGDLIIFKQHSIFALGYATDGIDAFYPVRQCHSAIGCDIPNSVQLIDNRLVFGNTQTGVHALIGTSNQLETNVKPLSANINELLFRETNLKNAISVDYGQYYFLCVNGRAYLWDYGAAPFYSYSDYDKAQRRLAWYRWDNINATCFFSNTDLYYGSANGIVKFIPAKNDFNSAITAYFKTKAFDLGVPHILKTFTRVYPSFASDANIDTTISVENEEDSLYRFKTYDIKSFNWATFNWVVFSWNGIKYSQPKAFRLKMKKKKYIQIKAESTELNRGLGLVGLRISYFPLRPIKR
ncbi:MAG: hypothetical protein M0R40_10975, partial [Firmicutes bacterium]|nr:hypothetical protein [Bacillota bacterium]